MAPFSSSITVLMLWALRAERAMFPLSSRAGRPIEDAEKVQALVNEWTRRRLLRNILALFHRRAVMQNVSDLAATAARIAMATLQ